nr:NfeD family protein [Actinocrispum wychmicini]
MAAWIGWLIGGLILIAAEVASGTLWLLMIGTGALAASVAAAVTDNLVVSTVVFAVASIALAAGIRPMLHRRLHAGPEVRTNTQALIGAKATVVGPGRVKIGGEVWSARAEHHPDDEVFRTGASVIVVEISGATAVVAPEP